VRPVRKQTNSVKIIVASKLLEGEREKFWRALWQTKKRSKSQVDEFPPLPACFGPMHPQITAINSQIGPAVGPYADDTLQYSTGNTPPFSDVAYPTNAPSELATRSPSIPYTHGDNESHRSANQFTPYPSPSRNVIRDVTWAPPIALDSGHARSSSSSHLPTFVESPNVTTADVPYLSRYSGHSFELPPDRPPRPHLLSNFLSTVLHTMKSPILIIDSITPLRSLFRVVWLMSLYLFT
jgi:hypothetical protein